jgi:hypothetical protein
VAKAWPQELELDPQERQSTLNSNIFSFNRWPHTTTRDWSKSTQTTTQQTYWPSMSQQGLCNDTSNKLDLVSSTSTFTEATSSRFTSSLQQAATPAFTAARLHQNIQVSLSSAMGSTIVDQPFCCNYILEYINMIFHHVFQHDSRCALPQHECRLHGEVYAHVPYNMSVTHNMFLFCWARNSTVWCV